MQCSTVSDVAPIAGRKPPTFLFDLGGVLYDTATFRDLRMMLVTDLPDDALKARWLGSPAVRAFELGRVSPQEFGTAIVDEWRIPVSPEEFVARMAGFVKHPCPGAEALLARLRANHVVCCLSNSNALHWERVGSFLDCFDSAFSSHLLGEIKPDEAAFRKVMGLLGVEAESLWFFDDSRPNVAAAERLGIRSFLVDGVPAIERVLRAEGVISGG